VNFLCFVSEGFQVFWKVLSFQPVTKLLDPLFSNFLGFSDLLEVHLAVPEVTLYLSVREEPIVHKLYALFSMQGTSKLNFTNGILLEHFYFFDRANFLLNLFSQFNLKLFEKLGDGLLDVLISHHGLTNFLNGVEVF